MPGIGPPGSIRSNLDNVNLNLLVPLGVPLGARHIEAFDVAFDESVRCRQSIEVAQQPSDEKRMGKVLLEMSKSLDGYVAGPDVSAEAPVGRGGEPLHEWMFGGRSAAESQRFETDHSSSVGALNHRPSHGRPRHRLGWR